VLAAANGEDALSMAAQQEAFIDLLITDVVMPGMTGRELSRRLADLRPHLQVLYISGYTANVIAHQGILDPGVEYLPKPFTPVQLAVKVRQVLGRAGS
jgi:CheY-like chemotaxis protein